MQMSVPDAKLVVDLQRMLKFSARKILEKLRVGAPFEDAPDPLAGWVSRGAQHRHVRESIKLAQVIRSRWGTSRPRIVADDDGQISRALRAAWLEVDLSPSPFGVVCVEPNLSQRKRLLAVLSSRALQPGLGDDAYTYFMR